MLKQRLLTAAVLIPLVLIAILLLPNYGFLILVAVIAGLASWEWLSMAAMNALLKSAAILAMLGLALWSVMMVTAEPILMVSLVFWILISLMILIYANRPLPTIFTRLLRAKPITYLLSILVSLLFIYSSVWLHSQVENGPMLVLYVLISVWLADTGGYFAGKRWGQRALAKNISPNKTMEGLLGALVLVLLWSLIGFYSDLSQQISLSVWIGISLLTGLVSVAGDLFESLFKRSYQIKDSGHLLPGHGGMLDRVDSLLAAVPFFTALVWLSGLS